MLGGTLGSGKPVGVLMERQGMMIILLVLVAVLTPLGFRLAKWMNHRAFGVYIGQLKANIDALKM